MLGFIIWLIGVILAVKAVLDILKWNINPIVKILVAILLLATSWIGLIIYYLWGKDNLERLSNKSLLFLLIMIFIGRDFQSPCLYFCVKHFFLL